MTMFQGSLSETLAEIFDADIEKIIAKWSDYLTDIGPIRRLLTIMNPEVAKVAGGMLPRVVGFAVGQIPASLFKSSESFGLFRSKVNEAAKALGTILIKKGGQAPTVADYKAALQQAEAIDATKCVVDRRSDVFHLTTCLKAQRLHPNDRQDASLAKCVEDSIAGRLHGCPWCFEECKKTFEKRSATTVGGARGASRKVASFLDLTGSMELDGLSPAERVERIRRAAEEQRQWLQSLGAEDRQRLIAALPEQDLETELVGLMSMPPELRMEFLPLLENRNAIHAVRHVLRVVGEMAKAAGNTAAEVGMAIWFEFLEWDYTLEDDVALARFKGDELDKEYEQIKSRGFIRKILSSLNPFN